MPLTFVFVYRKNAMFARSIGEYVITEIFLILLGSDGNKQGTQYNKRRCILDSSHLTLFILMMVTEAITFP